MLDKRKLKDNIISIFEKFNIFDNTIGNLRDDTLKCIDSTQEEPVSEDFEEALAKEWKGYNDRGAATVDALEDNTQELAFAKGFYRGAKWKNEQMMTKAADMVVGYQMPNGLMLTVDETENCYDINEDDRVKVIVIKKD